MDNTSLFRSFINWLFIKPRNVERYYDPDLHPINTDKIYKELRIETRAKELGEANQPSSSDTILSGVEREIIQRVEKARQDYLVWASQRLKALNQDIAQIDISVLINKANQANQEFERQANALLSGNELLLHELREISVKKNKELEDFKLENELNRLAVYPTNTLFRWALLLFLACVESAFNSFLFAKGVSSGYIGGFFYALIFSVINIGTSFANGLFWLRYIYHIKFSRKLIGIFSIILWVSLSTLIAFSTAHFRDALSMDVEDPAKLALQTLLNQPIGLNDQQSWLLLFISIILSLFSYSDGLLLKDSYPGYSDKEKRAKLANDDYHTELGYIRDKLTELKDEALEKIENILNKSKQEIDDLHELIESKKALKSKIEYSLPDVENCMFSLINEFRNINKIHRKTESPKYFSEPIKPKKLELPNFSINLDIEKHQNQSLLYTNCVEKVEEIRAYIQSSFNRKHDSLIPLTEHFDLNNEIYEKKIISFKKTGS